MKIAIVYDSNSGNTKMLAEAIKEEVNPDQLIYFGKPDECIDADLYIVGSWTQKGNCTPKISKFLQGLKNKKIVYFGTAGYGGSVDYYKNLVERVKVNIDDSNEFIDWYYCQGKMPISVRSRYEKMIKEHPEDKKLEVSLENFDAALSHPDADDLNSLKSWIKKILEDGF
ncbi:MAG: flavodoxin family protein [Tissierellia bacterium]|nr:flavodoxin family protein [Tissierellia bacterium]